MAGTDFSHLTNEELISGIKALNIPDYIRSKAYGIDVRETLAQMTEMLMQLAYNQGMDPQEAQEWAMKISKIDDKADQSFVDSQLSAIVSGAPKGTFTDLTALRTAHPNGTDGVFLVLENGHWYYWNDTTNAWTDGGIYQASSGSDFPATNLVSNGDFVVGVGHWFSSGDLTIENYEAQMVANAQHDNINQQIPLKSNHKYYFRANVRSTSNQVRVAINRRAGIPVTPVYHSGSGKFEELADIAEVSSTDISYPHIAFEDLRTSGFDAITVRKVMVLDLTDIFGLGNEPTLKEIDQMMSAFPNKWFDGTVSPFIGNQRLYNILNSPRLLARNDVQNPALKNLLNGWNKGAGNPTLTANGSTLIVQSMGGTTSTYNYTRLNAVVGNKLYAKSVLSTKSDNVTSIELRVVGSGGGSKTVDIVENPIKNTAYTLSGTLTLDEAFSNVVRLELIERRTTTTSNTFEVSKPVLVDITKTFGKNNEPSAEFIQELFALEKNAFFIDAVDLITPDFYLIGLRLNSQASTGLEVKNVKLIKDNEIDVKRYNSGQIDVDSGWATQVYFYGTKDGVTYQKLTVQSTTTGTNFGRVDVPGKYQVDINGIEKIKYTVITLGAESHKESIEILLSSQPYQANQPTVPSTQYYPTTMPTVTQRSDTRTLHHLNDVGVSYYVDERRIYESDDYGETFSEITAAYGTWGNRIVKIHYLTELENGRLLVWTHDWKDQDYMTIYRSNTEKTVFEEVLSYPYEGNINPGWKPSVYENIVVYGEYYPGRTTETLRVKLSQDSGETWKFIKDIPQSVTGRVHHIHDVVYDPYRTRIWILHGDFHEHANVEYSDDFGETWHYLWEEGTAPVQFTTCHPMPNKVLLGSDSPMLRGMYVYLEGTTAGDYIVEPVKIWTEEPELGSAMYRGDQYWDCDNVVYFGSTEQKNGNDPGRYVLWGTKDGFNLYQLYSMDGGNGGRFDFLSGPDSNGKMMAIRGTPNGNVNYVIDVPTWETI